jgi:hypothetical protein
MFKRRGSFTTGLHFFITDSRLSGGTSGPAQLFDVIVAINRGSDQLALRCCGKECEVVRAALIRNRSSKGLETSVDSWKLVY